MKKIILLLFVLCSFSFAGITKSIDLPDTKQNLYKNNTYIDIGYYTEIRQWWILGFGLKESKWVLTTGKDTYLNLTEKDFNKTISNLNITLPKTGFVDQIIATFNNKGMIGQNLQTQLLFFLSLLYAYSGFGLIGFILAFIAYEFFKEKKVVIDHKLEQLNYKKNKTKILKCADIYSTLMCKKFNTDSNYLKTILQTVKDNNDSSLNINITIKNNFEKYSTISCAYNRNCEPKITDDDITKYINIKKNNELILDTFSKFDFDSIYFPTEFFNSDSFNDRNHFLVGQIKKMFSSIYGFNIFENITTDNPNATLNMNITCLVDIASVANNSNNIREGFITPMISYMVDFKTIKDGKQVSLFEPIVLFTTGLISEKLLFKDMEDLYTKLSQLHTIKFTSNLITKLGMRFNQDFINSKYNSNFHNLTNKNIEETIDDLKVTGKYNEEQLNLIRKQLYIKNTSLNDKIKMVGNKDVEKSNKELKKQISEVVDDAKEDGFEQVSDFLNFDSELVSNSAQFIALGVAISQKEYTEAVETGMDIGFEAFFG